MQRTWKRVSKAPVWLVWYRSGGRSCNQTGVLKSMGGSKTSRCPSTCRYICRLHNYQMALDFLTLYLGRQMALSSGATGYQNGKP